ncbi:hypothetical protein BKA81DRAFT_352306 [Phyllosticta paracitricarpa]
MAVCTYSDSSLPDTSTPPPPPCTFAIGDSIDPAAEERYLRNFHISPSPHRSPPQTPRQTPLAIFVPRSPPSPTRQPYPLSPIPPQSLTCPSLWPLQGRIEVRCGAVRWGKRGHMGV